MKHLDEFNVAFSGVTPRVNPETKVPYNRANFRIKGTRYSVNCGQSDPSGKAGVVMFVKKGETLPSGEGTVAKDAFSLIEITSAEAINSSNDALNALNALPA